MMRLRAYLFVVIGVSILCQPYAGKAQTLPNEPTPPPASDARHLSTEEGLNTAIDWAKFGKEPDTNKLVDVAIGIMTVGYPPAGIALGFAKALIMSGGPDPVGSALKVLDERINVLNKRLDDLQQQVEALRDEQLRIANRERLRWLLDHRDDLTKLSYRLKQKPTDKNEKENIAYEAQLVAARFLAANDPDRDLWRWSDVHVFTDRRTNHLSSSMLPADFKPLPTFEYYVSALVLWMGAIEYASGGDARYVTGNRSLVNELLKHATYLSVRPGWRGELNDNDPAVTLPEQIMRRVHCYVKPTSQYPTNRSCTAIYMCEDLMRRTEKSVGTVDFEMPSDNMMCSLKMQPPRGVSIQEQDVRAASYRQNPMYGSAAFSEWQKWRVAPVVPDEEKLELSYGIDAMTLLADRLVRLAKFGTTREQFTGIFDPATASFNLLYAVKPNGELLWYMHRMGTKPKGFQDGTKSRVEANTTSNVSRVIGGNNSSDASAGAASDPLHTLGKRRRVGPTPATGMEVMHAWDGPKLVGQGWQSFRDVMSAGGSGIYAITRDGKLKWYRHDGFLNGTPVWANQTEVGSGGWDKFIKVVPAGDGVLYAIEPDGTLKWYKHNGYLDGSVNWAAGPIAIGSGWAQFKNVFSGGAGILYAITQDGKLVWYKHNAYLNAVPMAERGSSMVGQGQMLAWARSWQDLNPKVVGTGWGVFKNVFSPGDGNIYAIKPTGEVLWYKHDGYEDGTARWSGPVEIAVDWKDFQFVFPRMLDMSNAQQIVR